jgi:hypothetical protein|tara:strand:- start:1151 stop:1300 length:150 start_codon:yes stop_codon:yes gene_type:complete
MGGKNEAIPGTGFKTERYSEGVGFFIVVHNKWGEEILSIAISYIRVIVR